MQSNATYNKNMLYKKTTTGKNLFLWLGFSWVWGLATTVASATNTTSTFRSYETDYTVKVFLADKFLSVLSEDFQETDITYKSNRPLALGIGFYTPRFGFSFSYGFDFLRNQQKGRTESIDIQYTRYIRNWYIDIIGQYYTGFYLDDSKQGSLYTVFNDMKILRAGINAMHATNDRLSLQALFSDTEKQEISAGSFLIGGNIEFNQLTFGYNDSIHSGNRQTGKFLIGPSIGYAYSWVPHPFFHISIATTLSANLTYSNSWNVTPVATPRIGFGYDRDTWEIFMQYKNHIAFTDISSKRQIAISSGLISIGFIRRFNLQFKNPKLKQFMSLPKQKQKPSPNSPANDSF